MGLLHLKAAGFSHMGMKRHQNQDHFLLAERLNLFIVADGMGGHQGGETASALAIETIEDYFKKTDSEKKLDPVKRLQRAILSANDSIQKKGNEDPDLQGMGTTVTALYFCENKVIIGHVGDSRGYLVHPQRIWQVTKDHSLVQEKLRAGLITRSQLKMDKMRNVITRSVGFEPEVDVDVYELEPRNGDVFVLCSDGLTTMVDDLGILQVIERSVFKQNALEEGAQALIEAANRSGGDDNVTALIVKVA